MFDYEIQNNNFKLVYVFEPLNKPRILQLLEADMKLILLQHLQNREAQLFEKNNSRIYKIKDRHRYYYILNPGNNTVQKTRVKGLMFTKEKVDYLYTESLTASHIQLKHKGLIRLKIELSQITKPISN